MNPLEERRGFGQLVNADWLSDQDVDDPDAVVRDLVRARPR